MESFDKCVAKSFCVFLCLLSIYIEANPSKKTAVASITEISIIFTDMKITKDTITARTIA